MDATRFDRFAKLLAGSGARRELLAVLAALPLGGALAAVLDDEEAAAKGRRRSGKRKRNKKGKRKGKKCTPARLCAGQCGTVKKKTCKPVDCGPCACDPPCPVCQTCDAATAQCVPNAALDGQDCGEPGQVCIQGSCACGAQACRDAGGCCAGTVCVPTDFQSDPAHCGSCQTVCPAGEPCLGGACCAGLLPTDDLQAAINAAAPGATLSLCPGTWYLTSRVTMGTSLTLRGAGTGLTVLDGGDAVRVLFVGSGATVTLEAMTIAKGNADQGGGIFNRGNLTLREVAVTGNAATTPEGGVYPEGGGIFNDFSGTVTLDEGSQVSGNSADRGGGIFNWGIVTLRSSSRVSGNSARYGGGVYNNGGLTLEDGSLIGGASPAEANSASSEGGGIYNAFNTTMKSGSEVSGNSATSAGGGIASFSGTLTLQSGSRVSGNSAVQFRGGGIFDVGGVVTLESGALVCDNQQPLGGQCEGSFVGVCPFPANGICPV